METFTLLFGRHAYEMFLEYLQLSVREFALIFRVTARPQPTTQRAEVRCEPSRRSASVRNRCVGSMSPARRMIKTRVLGETKTDNKEKQRCNASIVRAIGNKPVATWIFALICDGQGQPEKKLGSSSMNKKSFFPVVYASLSL
ncbi:hypothetical protein CBL_04741 [Carabus blaptoides fortunei]